MYVSRVRFAGGELDGVEVAATQEQAERLPGMSLSVTPGGRLFDRQRQQYVPGVEVLRRPD
jgi:hypothetical protein